jgi:hypothetical protein
MSLLFYSLIFWDNPIVSVARILVFGYFRYYKYPILIIFGKDTFFKKLFFLRYFSREYRSIFFALGDGWVKSNNGVSHFEACFFDGVNLADTTKQTW